jgi:Terminase small subunit
VRVPHVPRYLLSRDNSVTDSTDPPPLKWSVIGFSDIRKVVSWRNELVTRTEKSKDGEPVLMPRVTIVDTDKISDEAAAAVAEVWQTVNGALRVKMHDKHAALVSLGKHLGLFTDNVQIQRKHAAKVVSRPC